MCVCVLENACVFVCVCVCVCVLNACVCAWLCMCVLFVCMFVFAVGLAGKRSRLKCYMSEVAQTRSLTLFIFFALSHSRDPISLCRTATLVDLELSHFCHGSFAAAEGWGRVQ